MTEQDLPPLEFWGQMNVFKFGVPGTDELYLEVAQNPFTGKFMLTNFHTETEEFYDTFELFEKAYPEMARQMKQSSHELIQYMTELWEKNGESFRIQRDDPTYA